MYSDNVTALRVLPALNERLQLLKASQFSSMAVLVNKLLNAYVVPDIPAPHPEPTERRDEVTIKIFKADLARVKQLQICFGYTRLSVVLEVIIEQVILPPVSPSKPAKPPKSPKTVKELKTKPIPTPKPPEELLFENILAYLDRQRKAKNKARREARES